MSVDRGSGLDEKGLVDTKLPGLSVGDAAGMASPGLDYSANYTRCLPDQRLLDSATTLRRAFSLDAATGMPVVSLADTRYAVWDSHGTAASQIARPIDHDGNFLPGELSLADLGARVLAGATKKKVFSEERTGDYAGPIVSHLVDDPGTVILTSLPRLPDQQLAKPGSAYVVVGAQRRSDSAHPAAILVQDMLPSASTVVDAQGNPKPRLIPARMLDSIFTREALIVR